MLATHATCRVGVPAAERREQSDDRRTSPTGFPKTRRSTSGGCLRVVQHTLATWLSTQKVVSPSSAESEYCSMVRCASEAIGLAYTVRELGHETHVRIWRGAAAARGVALRSGSGAIKHMETSTLCCSRKKNQELRIGKIRGTVNPADLMMKHLDGKRLVMLCDLLNIKHIGGRPSSAPKLTMDPEYVSRAPRAPGGDDSGTTSSSKRNCCAFWSRTRDMDRWTQSRLLDGSWVDNRGYHDLLHSYGSGVDVVELWKSR